jgi:hypothetical protein
LAALGFGACPRAAIFCRGFAVVAQFEDRIADFGLNVIVTEADHVYLNTTEPVDFATATSTALASYAFTANSGVFGAPYWMSDKGVIDAAGFWATIVADGTPQWWATTDNAHSRLLAHGALLGTKALLVTDGTVFVSGISMLRNRTLNYV